MPQPLGYFRESSSQTGGPYVQIGLDPNEVGIDAYDSYMGKQMVTPETKGERITIEGRLLDGSGTRIKEAVIEIWQANAAGRYASPADRREDVPLDPAFRGFGRSSTDGEGWFRFHTIKPGKVPYRDGRMMAPHVSLLILARGINIGLNTRMYFSDETDANAADPVLNAIEQPVRRPTLIGQKEMRGKETVYRFDIRLQGENETVFFDI